MKSLLTPIRSDICGDSQCNFFFWMTVRRTVHSYTLLNIVWPMCVFDRGIHITMFYDD